MSESKQLHWVENEDLLERFVLGRLESAEAAELEKHLQECDHCRKVAAKELEIVAGIRIAGRESLKQRLAGRLEERKAQSFHWYRAVGVAAGIVLLVTVGIYNRWFVGTETQLVQRDRADKTEKRLEPSPQISTEGQASREEKAPVNAARRSSDRERQEMSSLAAGAPRAAGSQSGKVAEAQDDRLRDLKAAEAGGESREKKDQFGGVRVASAIAATWVQGTVISERERNVPAVQAMGASAKAEQSVLRKGKADNLMARKPANVEAVENAVQDFILTQKPLSDLPQTQRIQQQQSSRVQTLLQKNPRGTRITVFLDSLLTKSEFERSRVQAITEDSIVLILGNRLVGYKLPPDWTGQGVQQIKKEK